MPKKKFSSRSGFSLLELAVVVGVIGVILGGIWALASLAWEKVRQEKATEELTSTVRNTRAYYAGQAAISGAAANIAAVTPQLATANVFPGDMLGCTGTASLCVRHPWTSTTTASASGSFGICPWVMTVPQAVICATGPSQYFAVEFQQVPSTSCLNLVAYNSGSAIAGLQDVVINGATSMAAAGHGFPVHVADAKAACTAAATVTVDFIYSLPNPMD